MKLKTIVLVLLGILMLTVSCRVKENCELNNTGDILVTNNTSGNLEVLVDNQVVFTLTAGESRSVTEDVGSHTVRCLQSPDEYTYDASVVQCETTEVVVPNNGTTSSIFCISWFR